MAGSNPGAVISRLLRYGRGHWGSFVASWVCMVVLGLATGAFAYLTGPALRMLLSGGSLPAGSLKIPGAHAVLAWLPRSPLRLIPALILGLAVIKGGAYLGQFYASGIFGQRVVQALRRDLYRKLLELSPVELTRWMSGDLLSRFGADVAAVELAVVYGVAFYLRDGLQLLILGAGAFWLSWRLALATFLVAPLAVVAVSGVTRRVLRRTREAQGNLGRLAAQLREGLGAARTIQAFDAHEPERRRFSEQTRAHRDALIQAAWARAAVPAIIEVLAASAVAGVLVFITRTHAVAPEQVVSFLVMVILMYQPAKDVGRATQFFQQATAAGERIFQVVDLAHPAPRPAGLTAPRLRQALTIRDVRYAYGSRRALEGLSLELPAGKITAVVGESGAGKSTLMSLLLGFAAPDSGEILIDGRPYRDFSLTSIRRQFALVTQEPLLFAQTVLENLRMAEPAASLEQITAAARAAQAEEFILRLPRGYDTVLEERGGNLSGGQRQRLCLARALLAPSPVLLLDEPTSSLDPQSEAEVQQALKTGLVGRTAIIIAHRLSTVANADQIHVLAQGRQIESGTHAELIAQGGTYARMWSLQSGAHRVNAA